MPGSAEFEARTLFERLPRAAAIEIVNSAKLIAFALYVLLY